MPQVAYKGADWWRTKATRARIGCNIVSEGNKGDVGEHRWRARATRERIGGVKAARVRNDATVE